ncbi:beta-lactamase superfamily domain-containing protein [Cokeromyces recurvatus]|uniref:beta-lactamase superfamily domain-containing protein n=1 Tax=Cokeromyces recurvatus TaxID=90255 RepID=UPI00221FEB74|nr:beta-lactamase superfamily domain-containing protein [Cokeromyces recurvatus]KAI7899000.1 beta-lactamase superfamily domain-containing protein [Cokeromyces recurvatus]
MTEIIKKKGIISGTTKKRFFAGSSLSFFLSYMMPKVIKRARTNPGVVKLISNHYTTVFVIATIASSLFCYYLIYGSKRNDDIETLRKRNILKRKPLETPEERYASLKIGRRFVNPFDEWIEVPFYKTMLFWMKRWKGNGVPRNEKELEKTLPVMKPDLDKIKNLNDRITFTWFGQSTCLITLDGLTILSDPVFSRCSINHYLGPKRLRPIPCQLEDFIDTIDAVIVSHDHFDHLDESVVKKLGNSAVWYIPLGLKSWFTKRNVTNVIELDWWQEVYHENRPDIMFACVPAMHWSGSRTPFEKNNTLWCSYVIKSQNDKIFFW